MARGRTRTVLVTSLTDAGAARVPDELVVEEPLTVHLDGQVVTTTMRTPGHDYELAVGFCFTEGLLAGAPVTGVRYCATGSAVETAFNVVTVETGGRAPVPTPRLTATTSSCGICGTAELDALAARLAPLPADLLPARDPARLVTIARRVVADQPLFRATGAVHAAVAVDEAGEVVVAREDVGRHNAVDKVIGHLLLGGSLPAHALTLVVTSRASFEIVQKAWAAGFGAVVAVSAPTALAVDTARRAGITLVGFVREGRANVYAPERVVPARAPGVL